MSDCIFCKIVNNEIPSNTFYEDEDFKCFLDAFPSSLGHAIIIPKAHTPNVFEIDKNLYGKLYTIIPQIANKLKNALNCDGINILQNNGEAAGQTVFHLHVHLIPRYNNDSVNIKWQTVKPLDLDIQKLLNALR